MKLLRITTVPASLNMLLTGQMRFMMMHDYEVHMISASGPEVIEVVQREGCPHHVVNFTRTISPFKDLRCLWSLIKLIKRLNPDIIHTHTPKAGLLGMIAAKICGVPVKVHTIAGLPLMTATNFKRKILISTERLTYWAADYVLPNSQSILSYVTEHKLTRDEKLDMIGFGSSNGIDLTRFSKESLDYDILENIKRSLAYDSDNYYLLSVGRVVKDKGIVELVDAFLQLIKSYDNLYLIILGPIENERREEKLPEEILDHIENNNRIIHLSWSNQVEHYMHIADILIHASHREGFPNVLMQAGAMECPIICSDALGNVDIVEDGITGLRFRVGDHLGLIKAIDFALTNTSKIQQYARRLKRRIVKDFSRESFHNDLLAFYQAKMNFEHSEL